MSGKLNWISQRGEIVTNKNPTLDEIPSLFLLFQPQLYASTQAVRVYAHMVRVYATVFIETIGRAATRTN